LEGLNDAKWIDHEMEIIDLRNPRCKTEGDEGWVDVEMGKRSAVD
jgi:hypothetical protein